MVFTACQSPSEVEAEPFISLSYPLKLVVAS
jgi:hypothetical protein